MKDYAPARINSFALGATLQFLHGNRPNILKVIGLWASYDGIPYHRLISNVHTARPFGTDVDK